MRLRFASETGHWANPSRGEPLPEENQKNIALRAYFLDFGCPRATNYEPIYLIIDWLVENPKETFAPEDYIRSSGNLILDYKY